MKKIKFIGIMVVILIIIFAILSFANNGEKQEKFVLGLDDSFPPMGFRNENNEIVGFDIDVARAVCEKLDMELELQPISWAAKEQELDSGNIDCIWNGFGYNEQRAEQMTLSVPYLKGGMIFLVNPNSEFNSQSDLEGKRIGVQTGSTGQDELEKSEFGKRAGEIIQYSDYLTALMDLEKGGVDAVYISRISGNYIIKNKNKDYKVIESENINKPVGMVIAFKKGNTELKDKVENALYELKEDGTLNQISQKWFGEDLILLEEK